MTDPIAEPVDAFVAFGVEGVEPAVDTPIAAAGAADAVDGQLLDRLVDQARSSGLRLAGEDGLLKQLTKRLLESALEGEITDHLGYDKHDPAGKNSGNSRNGVGQDGVLAENLVRAGQVVPPDSDWGRLRWESSALVCLRFAYLLTADFLRSQAAAIIACDFFAVDLLDGTRAHVLAVIEHASRRIHILGATAHPTNDWVTQQIRNLLMDLDGAVARIKFLIRDRDILYPPAFGAVLADADIRTVRSAVRAPRMNSIMERWIGGCRRELLDRTLVWNLPHLRRVLSDYEQHHNAHRPHMALHSAAPDKPLPPEVLDLQAFRTRRHDRIGGIIHEYRQAS